MTNEEAARLLDPETNLAAMEELQYYHGFAWQEILVKALREAKKMGADALRNTGCFRGDPLTLEQLREMNGQPVWIAEAPYWGHWELSEDAEDYILDRDPDLYGLTYPGPDGKGGVHKLGWLAYACPPAHIDREVWTAEWVEDGDCHHKPYRVRDIAKWKKYKCSKCGYKAGRRNSQNYCPSCGRAMTPEAWAELEKRISRKEEQ